jgi:hypothetical protein
LSAFVGFRRSPLGKVVQPLATGLDTDLASSPHMMTLDKIKAFGAPWPAAEVHISVQKKIARLVFLVRDGDGFRLFDDFALDFPWPAKEDFHGADALANAVLTLAKELELLVPGAQAEIVDLDGPDEQ